MKFPLLIFLSALSIAFTACGESEEEIQARFDSIQAAYDNPWNEQQAEQIVGNTVRFSGAGGTGNALWYSHTTKFVSDSADSLGQLSKLEFNFLEFVVTDSAIRSFEVNKEFYQNEGRLENLTDLGDQAFFVTDDKLFYFVFVRKGTRELRVRIDFISPATTKENLLKVAREIIEAM